MHPKVFISYSWSNPVHEDWVIGLAQRLMNDGVDVVIDKWDLKEGHDKYAFMESMVNSANITRVLIILDKKYAEKANIRDGGVGTETQIISASIYENVAQEKFIPIVAELDEYGKPYVPTYLNSRIYIDLSLEEHFENNYEKLLRNVLNRPSTAKPKLGQIPSYILEETPMNFKTTAIVRGFDSQIDRHPNRINSLVRDFLNEFFENLKLFRIKEISNRYDESGKIIYENLTQFIPLRDEFIEFIFKLSKCSIEFDIDLIIRFFEQLPSLFYPEESVGSWSNHQYVNFRFIAQELFIYTVSIFLKNENYNCLDHIFNTKYFLKDRYKSTTEPSSYTSFYKHIDTLNAYYEQLNGTKFIDVQADLMIKRLPQNFSKIDFINGDLLCYYVGLFTNNHWFPKTYIYKDEYNLSFDFFNRMISLRHFEKVKSILQLDTIEELKSKLDAIKTQEKDLRYNNSWSRVSPLDSLIETEQVGSSR